MNKKGQTLILFVILIPILLGLCALVIDVGLIVNEEVKLKEVSKSIIASTIGEVSIEEIKRLYQENDIPINNLKLEVDPYEIRVQNEYEIDSIFGSIIGIHSYKISIDITGVRENEDVIFE